MGYKKTAKFRLYLLVLCFVLFSNTFAAAQVVNLAVPADPDSFDPVKTVAAATSEIAFNIYEGLVKANPEGGVEGALATSWTIDSSKTIYTFYLREAKFHDGTLVTVNDVIHALTRAMDPKIAVRAGELSMIKNLEALDGAVQITLKEPHGAFLYTLTEVFASIYPAHAQELNRHPVGTGPFMLVEWKPNQYVLLKRFDQHWSKQTPYFSQAKFIITPDENSMVLNLKAGRVDIIPRLETSVLHQVQGEPTLKVLSFPMNTVQVLAINNAREPFTDLRVRQALAQGINREEVVIGAAWGYGVEIHSALSPAMSGFYNQSLASVNSYDPKGAMELLKEAQQEDLQLTLALPANYPLHVQTGELVAEQWKDLGIQVNLKIMEWGTWLDQVYTQRDYDVTIIGLAGRLDPHPILVRYTTGNSRNFFNFSDLDYDHLVEQGLKTIGMERQEVYLKAQEILAEKVPGIFVMDPPQLVAMDKRIKGWKYYPAYVVDLASLYK